MKHRKILLGIVFAIIKKQEKQEKHEKTSKHTYFFNRNFSSMG